MDGRATFNPGLVKTLSVKARAARRFPFFPIPIPARSLRFQTLSLRDTFNGQTSVRDINKSSYAFEGVRNFSRIN